MLEDDALVDDIKFVSRPNGNTCFCAEMASDKRVGNGVDWAAYMRKIRVNQSLSAHPAVCTSILTGMLRAKVSHLPSSW